MDRQEIMEFVAEWFEIEPDEGMRGYDWQAGCGMGNGKWLNLAEVVYCIEALIG